ncbi:hypothetical protein [Sulfodiicoccus acidiphilus]|nr:hypothetical protein [Sulfodiicoccus acidiphilus]
MDETRLIKFVSLYLEERIPPDCAEIARVALMGLVKEMMNRGVEKVINDFLVEDEAQVELS